MNKNQIDLIKKFERATSFAIEKKLLDGKPLFNTVLIALDAYFEKVSAPISSNALDSWKHLGKCAVLHCTSNAPIGQMIQAATGSKYSHSALYFLIDGKPFIIDSQHDGTQMRPFEDWVRRYRYDFEATACEYNLPRAKEYLGRPYDYRSLLLRHPFKLMTKKWLKDNASSNELCCSEYVALYLGFPNAKEMTPRDIREGTKAQRLILTVKF
jgi:hypothetical protein